MATADVTTTTTNSYSFLNISHLNNQNCLETEFGLKEKTCICQYNNDENDDDEEEEEDAFSLKHKIAHDIINFILNNHQQQQHENCVLRDGELVKVIIFIIIIIVKSRSIYQNRSKQ